MRVLHYLELGDPLTRSGIGTSVSHQRKALSRTDIEVVESPTATDDSGGLLNAAVGAVGASAVESADIVHCNMIGPGSLAVAANARRTGTPLVAHAHVTGEDFADSFRGSSKLVGPLKSYLRRFYSMADLVCCPSEYARDVLQSYPVEAPVRSVSNGVDFERLEGHDQLRSSYRRRFDLSGPVVFTVGNVFERKGLSTFCRLAQRTSYDFAWFGPYEQGLLASNAVRKWTGSPPDNVTFTGWIDDVRGAYGAGDIFLFPTHEENQGIAVLEAMACGKAVVLRRLPVFEEFYTHGEDCLMCETFSEFRDALDRLADSPELRRELGENARKTARDHDISRLRDELLSCYEEVADE